MAHPLAGVEEFYAHALAIEREAAERYGEFEGWFRDRGEDVLAGLCHNLAEMERKHLEELERGCKTLDLPPIDSAAYHWIEAGPPEAPARELFYRVAQPHHLLELALQGECNALAFYEWVVRTTPDGAVRKLAREMAQEEQHHVEWAAQALEYHPSHRIDWENVLP